MDPATLRILDANLNRAREGLRVLEEHARLVLNDAAACEQLKRLRHSLAEATRAFPTDALLDARDIRGDVGTRISTDAEQSRASPAAVAAAAAKRVQESLRVIEEYGKLIDRAAAARIEQLRYDAYDIESTVLLGGPRRAHLRSARLHVLITASLCNGDWFKIATAVVHAGADVIQLREKSLPDRELLQRAIALRALTAEHNALLIINDRPDIARLADADGVHLGHDDLPVSGARHLLGPHRLIGATCHNPDESAAAQRDQPDYLAVGPMFPSATKPDVAANGLHLLNRVAAATDLPIVAIGGISADRVVALRAATNRPFQIAVCQSVISSTNPASVTTQILAAMLQTPSPA